MTTTELQYSAFANDVHVGDISASELRLIKDRIFKDPAVAVSQALNIFKSLLVVSEKIFLAVPLLLVWLAILLFVFDPNGFEQLLRDLSVSSGVERYELLKTLLSVYCIALGIAACLTMLATNYRFGLRNHYADALNAELRMYFKSPASGEFNLLMMPQRQTF